MENTKEEDFKTVGQWCDYHSKRGAEIVIKNNLPVEAVYKNPIHQMIRNVDFAICVKCPCHDWPKLPSFMWSKCKCECHSKSLSE